MWLNDHVDDYPCWIGDGNEPSTILGKLQLVKRRHADESRETAANLSRRREMSGPSSSILPDMVPEYSSTGIVATTGVQAFRPATTASVWGAVKRPRLD